MNIAQIYSIYSIINKDKVKKLKNLRRQTENGLRVGVIERRRMKLDGYVQQLKGKRVFAMVTAGKSQVDFYYEESDGIKITPLYGKRGTLLRQYAELCGLLWDKIGRGEGSEKCRNFKDGLLFVPLRGLHGTMYVDFRYLGRFHRECGHTYLELKNGQRLESCKTTTGNEERIEEARRIAADIGIIGSPKQVSCPMPPVQEAHPAEAAPVVRDVSLERPQSVGVVKKKKTKKRAAFKEGALETDLIDAFPTNEEVRTKQWKHAEDIDRESFAYKTMQSRKRMELEEIGARLCELIAQCEGG